MKRLLIGVVVALTLSGQAYAESLTPMDYCEMVFKTAETTMSARQEGVSLAELFPKTKSELGQEMLLNAYSEPQYYTEEHKYDAEREFANRYYLDCLINYR